MESLACGDAETAIVRDGDVTYYECSLPFSLLREAVEPAEGREFFLSVLVHDPDAPTGGAAGQPEPFARALMAKPGYFASRCKAPQRGAAENSRRSTSSRPPG